MAVAFRAAGTKATATSGNVSPGLPAGHVANDILILVVASRDNVTHSVSGYTQLRTQTNNGLILTSSIWWKRDGGSESAPTVTHTSGSLIIAQISAYSGAITSGTAVESQTNWATTSPAFSTCTANSITPTVDGEMVVIAGAASDSGQLFGEFGVFSGSSPSMTERFDSGVDSGNSNLQIALDDGLQTTAAATGTRTSTLVASAVNNGIQISIVPPAAADTSNQPPLVQNYPHSNTVGPMALRQIPPYLPYTNLAPVVNYEFVFPVYAMTGRSNVGPMVLRGGPGALIARQSAGARAYAYVGIVAQASPS